VVPHTHKYPLSIAIVTKTKAIIKVSIDQARNTLVLFF